MHDIAKTDEERDTDLDSLDDAAAYEPEEGEEQAKKVKPSSKIPERYNAPERYFIPDRLSSAAFYNDINAIREELGGKVISPDAVTVFHNRAESANFKGEPDRVSEYNPLYFAIKGDNIEAAEMLLQVGANANYQYPYGQTPLHFAQSAEMVVLLRKYGANLNSIDNEGKTPICEIAQSANPAGIVGFLEPVEGLDGEVMPAARADDILKIDGENKSLIWVLLKNLNFWQEKLDASNTKGGSTAEVRVGDLCASIILVEKQLKREYGDITGAIQIAAKYGLIDAVRALLVPAEYKGRRIFADTSSKTRDGKDIFDLLEDLEVRTAEQLTLIEEGEQTRDEDHDFGIKSMRTYLEKVRQTSALANIAVTYFPQGKGHFSDYMAVFKHDRRITNRQIAIETGTFERYWDAVDEGLIVPDENNLQRFFTAYGVRADSHEAGEVTDAVAADRVAIEERAEEDGGVKKVAVIRALSATNLDSTVLSYTSRFLAGTRIATECQFTYGEVAEAYSELKYKSVSGIMESEARDRGAVSIANYTKRKDAHKKMKNFATGLGLATDSTLGAVTKDLVVGTLQDIAYRNIPRKSLNRIVDEYIELGKARDEINFDGLSRYWAAEWGLDVVKLADLLGTTRVNLVNDTAKKASKRTPIGFVDKISEKAEEASGEKVNASTRLKLTSIKQGNLMLGSVDELANAALEILAVENPKISDFVHNPIAQFMVNHMPKQRALIPYGVIDKTLVPNALLSCGLESRGARFTYFVSDAGLAMLPTKSKKSGGDDGKLHPVLIGELPFMMDANGKVAHSRNNFAADAAAYFGNGVLRKKLTAAFLGNSKYYTPSELIELFERGEIEVSDIFKTLRLQEGASCASWGKIASSEKADPNTIIAVEEDGRYMRITKNAERLADHIYKNFPRDDSKARFIRAAQGRLGGVSIAEVESEIERTYADHERELVTEVEGKINMNNPAFTLPVEKRVMLEHQKEIGGEGDALTTRRTLDRKGIFDLIYESASGISNDKRAADFDSGVNYVDPNTGEAKKSPVRSFADSLRRSNPSNEGFARAIAKRSGVSGKHQEMYGKIACDKIPKYDPKPIEDYIAAKIEQEKIPCAKRKQLLTTLRNNMMLAQTEVWNLTPAGVNPYRLIEDRGYIPDNDPLGHMKSQDIVQSLVPEGFPAHREFLQGLLATEPKAKLLAVSEVVGEGIGGK